MFMSEALRLETMLMNGIRPIEIISLTVKGYDGLNVLPDITKLNMRAKFLRDICFTSSPYNITLPE